MTDITTNTARQAQPSAAQPVLFVSHGAPTFAIDPGQAGPRLQALGLALQQHNMPKAVLVVSAHWFSRGTVLVESSEQPATVHDFGGFPQQLYQLQYPVAGHVALAQKTIELLHQAGFPAQAQTGRGLDHGAWVPLMHMLPDANIPVFQVSLPYPINNQQALELGQALAPLRHEGVLIVGSGSLTHNLYEFRQRHGDEAAYVHAFAAWAAKTLGNRDTPALLNWENKAPDALRAHPTPDHFLPLLVAYGASTAEDAFHLIDGGVAHGVLSMDAYAFGSIGAADAAAPAQLAAA